MSSSVFSSFYFDAPVSADYFKDTVGFTVCPGIMFQPWDDTEGLLPKNIEIGGRLFYSLAWINDLFLTRYGFGAAIGIDLLRETVPWLIIRPTCSAGLEWAVRTDSLGLIDNQPGIFMYPSLELGIRWTPWLETSVFGNIHYSLNTTYQVLTFGIGLKTAIHFEKEPKTNNPIPESPESGPSVQTSELASLSGEVREIVRSDTNLEMTSSQKEIRIKMADIIFPTGSSIVKAEYTETVISIGKAVALYPNMKVLLEGHTDNVGGTDYNISLSRLRAKSVAELFFKAGIARNHIETAGYGPNRPIVENTSDANRRKNRRVEIRISWYDGGEK